MLRSFAIGVGLCALQVACAQTTWSYHFGLDDSTTMVTHCVEDASGRLFVSGTNALEVVLADQVVELHRFSNEGVLLESNVITSPLGTIYPNVLLEVPGQPGFTGLGGILLNEPADLFRPYANGFFRFNDQLDLVETRMMEPTLPRYGTVDHCLAEDGSVVGVGASYEEGPGGEVRFKIFRFSADGDSLNTCDAFIGQGFVYTIHPWPDGGYLCASYSGWAEVPLRLGAITLLEEDLCTVRWNFAPPDVIPNGIPQPSATSISNSINAFPLGDSHIILAGLTFLWTDTEFSHRTAVQVVDTNGALVRQRTFYTSYPYDLPADFQGLDTTFNDHYYYAQMDGCEYDNEFFGIPCNVRVHLLDTILNSIGEYVFDGYAENKLYDLRRIRSALDGGVYLMGRVMDLNADVPQYQGWIAKVGLHEFTTAISEQENRRLNFHPNPGSSNFRATLDAPARDARAVVVDALGKTIHSERLTGNELRIDGSTWPAGVYLVRVQNADGVVVASGRWVKV